ncbi:MAG: SDR family NAD(P)-dependent oxidoreductase [Lachnospiraceae bacterium]|nr:SDR family NAD(P)-dependent oxidoreductase [Lachnospiraceae bacterium]
MTTAIITGASHGIGGSLARLLVKSYDCLAICSRDMDGQLKLLRDELSSINSSCRVLCFAGDVSDFDFISAMVDTVYGTTDSIDVLINNAGISKVGLLTDMSIDEWNEIISINLGSVFNTCKCVVPHMIHAKSGRIINVSSVWGNVGASCEVAYSATKSGINGFTRALAKELAPSHISVNAIAFGAIDTRMNSHLSQEELNELAQDIPAGRLATPEEAAQFIQNILNTSAYFTGEVIKFDGAWT